MTVLTSTMKAKIYSIQVTLSPDGLRYVRVFIGYDAADELTKGLSLMSITADEKVFDLMPEDLVYPLDAEIDITMLRGGQNKMKQHVISVRPLSAGPSQSAQAKPVQK